MSQEIKYKIRHFNENPSVVNSQADELLRNLLDVKDIMITNLDKVIQRDGKIDVILNRAEALSTYSKTYKRRATKTKQKMRRRKLFYFAMLVLVMLILAFFLSVLLCGGFTFDACRASEKKT